MATIDQQDPMATVDEYSTDEEEELDESAMSLVDHLEELRWRIFKSIIAVVVGAIAAFFFRVQIMTFLTWPLPKTADQIGKGKLIVTGLAEGFTVFLKLSLAAGILLAIPVILYQIWAFVAPGLYDKEKKNSRSIHFRRHSALPGRYLAWLHRAAISSAVARQLRIR